ncbi:hypothetical protein P9250_12980 [Caballeronia sp. LP006]|jgi:hypothetical protein|uniref:hypothetical protein n=1 Tax=unclassified Caballeronia TaxID=2646786 RepID=UPI001FD150B1|nr:MULTISPECIES: hypothetical protein [unclassified Caballeronia]MDR5775419.1 hypothetical protein [Caballeronia sp. LZ002]MDR5801734.1 hypothetical protein [Caballeronia sp. LZ001]MDR5828796.1 hypothetical protein [Caballeronia sp. LP006]MDR5850857.1 hypothetical protein [Caballeronia sp. LZ003]
MDNFDFGPAKGPLIASIVAPAKALLSAHNVIRKARGEPPFTDDVKAFAAWVDRGEPEEPAMAPVLCRLIRDGYTS